MAQWLRSLLNMFKKEPLLEGSSSYLKERPKEETEMWLFVGLGNPGEQYAKNRHNVGFMVLDALLDEEPSFTSYKAKFQGKVSEGRLGNTKIVALKPTTYMNNSGQSVGAAAKFYKIPPENIIVFHDELDIAPGDVRVKQGGGNAGHNGLKSIQAHLGTADFWRVRIGIGRPQNKQEVSNYVLSDFAKSEHVWVDGLIENLSSYSDVIIKEDPMAYERLMKEKLKR